MWLFKLIFVVFVWCQHTTPAASQWQCASDAECGDVRGAVCLDGVCGCRTGQQLGLGGSACVDLAPYHNSVCVEDHQCSRLFTMFECRKENEADETGSCACQEGNHYFLGRCWPSVDYGRPCTRHEECLTVPRNPYSLTCEGVCVCAEGYYERQRGECRKIAHAVGDGCVVDEDCQFTNGVCDISSLQCVDGTASRTAKPAATASDALTLVDLSAVTLTAVMSAPHDIACDVTSPCPEPLECSAFGACLCPSGYYLNENGTQCYAELGVRSTAEQCVGLLAQVIDGICTCPPNFFFDENMRDCVKVTRRITDSCVSDENCHTFGPAAQCGSNSTWGLRSCECDTQLAVWDERRQMCRLFAGIGEACETDSDCLAGEFEIQCVEGTCTCPQGLIPFEGLCLTTGLGLGEECQASVECTATANTECVGGRCSCGEGYQQQDDYCAANIGGSCIENSDCVVENTVCVNDTNVTLLRDSRLRYSRLRESSLSQTCQCREGYVAYDNVCWTVAAGYESRCNVSKQCTSTLGDLSSCVDGTCACDSGAHHRDGRCHPVTGLFEPCSRTSQCYLQSQSERTVCRNSVCQCVFEFPYNEKLHTCGDARQLTGSATIVGSKTIIVLVVTYLTMFL